MCVANTSPSIPCFRETGGGSPALSSREKGRSTEKEVPPTGGLAETMSESPKSHVRGEQSSRKEDAVGECLWPGRTTQFGCRNPKRSPAIQYGQDL